MASQVAQWLKNQPAKQETWVQSLGQEDPLEEEMATPSNILSWKIPWREEPGRLQSMKLQNRLELATKQQQKGSYNQEGKLGQHRSLVNVTHTHTSSLSKHIHNTPPHLTWRHFQLFPSILSLFCLCVCVYLCVFLCKCLSLYVSSSLRTSWNAVDWMHYNLHNQWQSVGWFLLFFCDNNLAMNTYILHHISLIICLE